MSIWAFGEGNCAGSQRYLFVLFILAAGTVQRIFGQPSNTTSAVGGLAYTIYDTYNTQAVTIKAAAGYCTSGSPPVPVEELTIDLAHEYMLNGSLTCSQLVQAYIQRITAYDKLTGLNSILALVPSAQADAAALDSQLEDAITSGSPLPSLFCVPFIAKDLYDVVGTPSTAGSVALQDNFPARDAVMVRRVKAQGAVVIAKSTLSEFAFSAVHSIGSAFGTVRNAYDLDRSTGGSSGGSAAAMAANLGLMSFGSDTGSSIRTPAAFGSLVGIRPSLGLISRLGIVPLDNYHDTGGPIGRTVADVARTFSALPGYDPEDILSHLIENMTIPENYMDFLDANGLQGKRIGVLMQLATRPKSDQVVMDLFMQAIADMQTAGAEIVMNVSITGNTLGDMEFEPDKHFQDWYVGFGDEGHWESLEGSCPGFKESLEGYLQTAGTANKRMVDMFYNGLIHPISVDGFQADLTNFNTSATFPPEGSNLTCNCLAYDQDPCQGELSDRFTEMLDTMDLDAVIYPVQNNPPPYIGDWNASFVRNTYLAPVTGTPAITVPMGFTPDGLPSGIMIHGRHFDEPTLFTLAYAYEQATNHRRPSPLFPECAEPSYVPLSDVVAASSNAYNLAASPVAQPAASSAVAGRRLRESSSADGLSGQALGMSQHNGFNLKLHN